jgi:hypothetical protein
VIAAAVAYVLNRAAASAINAHARSISIHSDIVGTALAGTELTVADAVAPFASSASDVADAVFVNDPGVAGSCTMTVIVALAPFASVPTEHVIGPVPLHEPDVEAADPNVAPAGGVSVTTTFVAVAGPLFVTVVANVTFEPAVGFAGVAVIDSVRSATGTASSFVIVPRPCASVIVAFDAPERLTTKVSFGSTAVSPLTTTVIVCVVTPAANVSVPLVAA